MMMKVPRFPQKNKPKAAKNKDIEEPDNEDIAKDELDMDYYFSASKFDFDLTSASSYYQTPRGSYCRELNGGSRHDSREGRNQV